jgi:glutamate/tyrosine decarboxylase-like PLP-dependent enzyme
MTWQAGAMPDRDARRRLLLAAGERLADVFEAIDGSPILRHGMLGPALTAIETEDFAASSDPETAIAEVIGALAVRPGWQSHRMTFGGTPQPMFPGVLGELIAASLNPQLSTWDASPVANAIEQRLVDFVGEAFGFPEGRRFGHFTSGGAEANTTALIVALNRAYPEAAEKGLAALPVRPVIYVSAAGHPTFTKAARMTGLGTDNLRRVPIDQQERMRTDALATAIETDLASGLRPLMVVATAATTVAGAIDPLPAIFELCRRHGLWLHVDAALGGAAALCRRGKTFLEGIQGADSVTFNAHKWPAMPLAAGMFICKDAAILRKAFAADSYFGDGEDEARPDPCVSSIQWSRRANGLKLFLALKILGADGLAGMIERSIELGDHLREALTRRGWRIENDTPLPVVCFTDPGGAAPDLISRRLILRGQAFVMARTLGERRVLRAGVISAKTSRGDIERLMELLDAARRALSGGQTEAAATAAP